MRRWNARWTPWIVLSFAGIAACSRPNTSGGSRGTPSVITRDDIERAHSVTALDAVQRYRGDMLTPHGPSSILLSKQTFPVVFLGTQLLGEVDELRNVAADGIEEIRFYSGPEALTKFGSRYGGGVIQIIPRSG